MNLRQIEMFRAIMSTGSFTAAAALMHISQPGVSRAVRHLETQLGVALFERRQGRIFPTAEAQALHREVERSYRGVQVIQDFARNLKAGANPVVRVVASANVGLELVPEAIAQMTRQGRDARFALQVLRGPLLVDALLQERADIGITAVPLEHPSLESRPLGQWRLVCVYPDGHVLGRRAGFSMAEALRHPIVAFTSDTPQGLIAERWFEGAGPRRVVQVRSGLDACALVAKGAGISFADDLTARFFRPQGLRWRDVPDSPRFTAHAVWNASAPPSRAARKLCDLVERLFDALGG